MKIIKEIKIHVMDPTCNRIEMPCVIYIYIYYKKMTNYMYNIYKFNFLTNSRQTLFNVVLLCRLGRRHVLGGPTDNGRSFH